MKIISLSLAAALAAATLFTSSPAEAHGGYHVNARQARQQDRIAWGAATGRLTACETARLQTRSNRIARSESHYRATGGLQPWERRNLNHRQNSLSRDIREQNHDGRGCW
jgi:hypothetical protein